MSPVSFKVSNHSLTSNSSPLVDSSKPNAALVQDAIFRLERKHLPQYELPGNRLSREGYQNVPLPWTVDPPITEFPQAGFSRVDWDRDGHLTDPDHFFLGDKQLTLAQIGKRLGTASMVTRWREAHPQQAGTEEDVVNVLVRDLRKTLNRDDLITGASCHLLLFKRQRLLGSIQKSVDRKFSQMTCVALRSYRKSRTPQIFVQSDVGSKPSLSSPMVASNR